MSYKLTHSTGIPPLSLHAYDLKMGDIAVITSIGGIYKGNLILRTFDGIVNLDHPNATWEKDCDLQVRLLLPGEVITIIIQRD